VTAARTLTLERAPPMSAPSPPVLPDRAKAKLSVLKGLRAGKNEAVKQGVTSIGRKGPRAVDVGLTEQESPGVAVKVNRWAFIWFDKNGLAALLRAPLQIDPQPEQFFRRATRRRPLSRGAPEG
jgi:hypothetical protein